MRNITCVAAAVAAVLGTSSAFALTPTQIASDIAAGTLTTVYLTGSSAFRDEMFLTLKAVCASNEDAYGADASFLDPSGITRNTWDGYNPTSGAGTTGAYSYNGPDFRAYSCTLKSSANLPGAAPALQTVAGSDVLLYYRAEGGSVYGVAPLVLTNGSGNPSQVMSLTIPNPSNVPTGQAACSNTTQLNGVALATTTKNGFNTWICAVPMSIPNTAGLAANQTPPSNPNGGWWLPYDNWSGTGLTTYSGPVDLGLSTPTMGVSDVEAAALSGKNYPAHNILGDGTALGTALSAAKLATLTSNTVLQQGFGVILGSTGSVTPGLQTAGLSKLSLTGIFTGQYTNWNQVPEAKTTASHPITICRRDPGSGTQTASSIFFANTYCGGASTLETAYSFPTPNGTSVLQYATTGDVQACVASNSDAIGISAFGSNPTGGKFIPIDGVAPTQVNLMNGSYKEWFEVNYLKSSGFNSNTTNQKALINGLIQGTSDSTVGVITTSAAGNYLYIPNASDAFGTDNAPSVANLANFVNVVTKGGNSCKAIAQPSNTN